MVRNHYALQSHNHIILTSPTVKNIISCLTHLCKLICFETILFRHKHCFEVKVNWCS